MIEWLLSWVWWFPGWAWRSLVDWAQRNPTSAIVLVLAIVRSFGTTVQTGWAGVLFTAGRARKVLEPGFHPLIPIFQKVRLTPVRSITLDLPRQRVTTADGLVYDVHANIVYRVEDPIKAMTAIDHVQRGVLTVVPLLIHALMREQQGETLSSPQSLDATLTAAARESLARWGIGVEQAGLATIAPTKPTIRLTQLGMRMRERIALLESDFLKVVPEEVAIALVSAVRPPRGRSHAGYHRRRHTNPFAMKFARDLLIRAELPKAGKRVMLDAQVLRGAPRQAGRNALRLLWAREHWPSSDIGFAEQDAVLDLAALEEGDFELPNGVQVHREEKVLRISPP